MDEGQVVADEDMSMHLDAIRGEVAALKDLFRRRLLDDRANHRALDLLHARAQTAESGLGAEYLVPVVSQLIRLVDRAELRESHDEDFVESLVDEIRVILENSGVEDIRGTDIPVDRRAHEVRLVRGDPPGRLYVESVIRRGYSYCGKILRPATVEAAYRSDESPSGVIP